MSAPAIDTKEEEEITYYQKSDNLNSWKQWDCIADNLQWRKKSSQILPWKQGQSPFTITIADFIFTG
jgi:hypothetical protein